jgi:hypothetical protein
MNNLSIGSSQPRTEEFCANFGNIVRFRKTLGIDLLEASQILVIYAPTRIFVIY